MNESVSRSTSRWVSLLPGWRAAAPRSGAPLVGVLEGEGIGPEVIGVCRKILQVLSDAGGVPFEIRTGGAIGLAAEAAAGRCLTPETTSFCRSIFEDGGAILCGPGGGRFVYDLRRDFDLYCKLTPVVPRPGLADTGPLRPERLAGVDILFVREQRGGIYQGEFGETVVAGRRVAQHSFCYEEDQVDRILLAALALAADRRGRLAVVHKPGGIPTISRLWVDRARELARDRTVEISFLEVDNACYQLIATPAEFDVVVSSNMFGDVLADTATVLLGSRGLSHSANFSGAGAAVYQTGHGAAHDIAGSGRANPLGQVLALEMMLRESFGLAAMADAVEESVNEVLAQGHRTADIREKSHRLVGTQEMGDLVAATLEARLRPRAGRREVARPAEERPVERTG